MKFEHSMDEIYPCDLCAFFTESLWDYQVHMEKSHRVESMQESDNDDMLEPAAEDFDEEEEEEDENKESILYSSSSSSSISLNNPKKVIHQLC